MPPTAEALLDDFNRANNTNGLGGNWTFRPFGGSTPQMDLESNAAVCNDASYCAMYWSAATFGPDCYAGINIGAIPSGDAFASARALLGIVGGIGTAAADGYQVVAYSGEVALVRYDNGVDTEIASVAHTLNVADIILLERIGTGFTIWRNRAASWTSLLTHSDGNHTGAGHIGMDMYDPAGTGTINDFYGGTSAAAGATSILLPSGRASRGLTFY
jgi:hypothetical protein